MGCLPVCHMVEVSEDKVDISRNKIFFSSVIDNKLKHFINYGSVHVTMKSSSNLLYIGGELTFELFLIIIYT